MSPITEAYLIFLSISSWKTLYQMSGTLDGWGKLPTSGLAWDREHRIPWVRPPVPQRLGVGAQRHLCEHPAEGEGQAKAAARGFIMIYQTTMSVFKRLCNLSACHPIPPTSSSILDWNCWTDWSGEVLFGTWNLPDSRGSQRKNLHWWCRHRRDWTPWPKISHHHHPTGIVVRHCNCLESFLRHLVCP